MTKNNYYTKESPKTEDIIVVRLTNITDNGIYGECITYPEYKVFLVMTEVSKRKQKVNVAKMFSPEKKYAVVVTNINTEMKIIDISYSKVHDSDQKGVIERHYYYEKIYNLGQDLIKMYTKLAKETGTYSETEINDMFKNIVQMQLDNLENENLLLNNQEKLENVKDKYLTYLEDPKAFFEKYEINPERKSFINELINEFVHNINKRVKISDVIISCDITLCVLTESAVNIIKKILTDNIDNKNIKIEHISSPKYRITVTEKRINQAKTTLDKCCLIIKENINLSEKITLEVPEKYTIIKDKEYSLSNYNA